MKDPSLIVWGIYLWVRELCGVLLRSRQSFGNVGVAFEIAGGYMFAQQNL